MEMRVVKLLRLDATGYRMHHILYSVRPISRRDLRNTRKENGRVIVAGVDESPVGAWANAEKKYWLGGEAGISGALRIKES